VHVRNPAKDQRVTHTVRLLLLRFLRGVRCAACPDLRACVALTLPRPPPSLTRARRYLVLACDGVWDVVSNEQCAALLLEKAQEGCYRPQDLAGEIIDKCFELQSKDNMSAIVVAFPMAPSNALSAEKKREYEVQRAARESAKEREAAAGGAGAMAEEGGGSA
jgi:hypothetical protein